MTDHYAEVALLMDAAGENIGVDNFAYATHDLQAAQIHATLALVDAQREANEQARIANLIALLNHADGDNYATRLALIEKGLGL